jgi:hypothetical protein
MEIDIVIFATHNCKNEARIETETKDDFVPNANDRI